MGIDSIFKYLKGKLYFGKTWKLSIEEKNFKRKDLD